MSDDVISIGSKMPLKSRRVLRWLGQSASYVTAIGRIEGLADGAILIRRDTSNGLEEPGIEITPEQARETIKALMHVAGAVERWRENARGFNAILIYQRDGLVEVECRGRRRLMRLSVLRGRRPRARPGWLTDPPDPPGRRCDKCGELASSLWVAADDLREGGLKVPHVEVCQGCVDKYANPARGIAGVGARTKGENTHTAWTKQSAKQYVGYAEKPPKKTTR